MSASHALLVTCVTKQISLTTLNTHAQLVNSALKERLDLTIALRVLTETPKKLELLVTATRVLQATTALRDLSTQSDARMELTARKAPNIMPLAREGTIATHKLISKKKYVPPTISALMDPQIQYHAQEDLFVMRALK